MIMTITIVPFNGEINSNEGKFYGFITLVQYDENRNEVFSQTVHNQLTDEGETFLLESTFREGTAPADTAQIGSICITNNVTVGEGVGAGSFDGTNSITGTNCVVDAIVDITTTQGLAVIGPLTFIEPTNILATETVDGIGICQANGGPDFTNCGTAGILFAVINTVNVTLAATETVDVTYTFNMTSPLT